ncbi:MAG: hypothetical protein EXR28_14895 [Betaproteobacteria bacterium]|nr:hypothetical protein [Betaproteobacteria bacterium]
MELFSTQFLSALLAIVVIDLVLAGDNAIVIALAARNVPKHLQKKAILWGTVGAIVVRTAMTIVVVWLLKIPGLLFAGGALLVWIAYKLLLPEGANEADQHHGHNPADTFWGALKTIVVADMVMGLDNVLAVAGAAHGNFVLVVLGLLISIPIVIWGSTLILKYVECYPAIVYLGAGVLAWTAAKMMASEPLLKDALAGYRFTVPLLFFVTVFGVLWGGWVANHRRLESQISAGTTSLLAGMPADQDTPVVQSAMPDGQSVLVPIDGSTNAVRAVRHVIDHFKRKSTVEVHLLNVQTPFSRHIALFSRSENRETFHQVEAEKALRKAREMLESTGIPHSVHIEIGDKAALIAAAAKRLACDHIVIGAAQKNSVTRMLEASVTNRVIELSTVPVEVISGDAVSGLERIGIPAGLCAAAVLLLWSAF